MVLQELRHWVALELRRSLDGAGSLADEYKALTVLQVEKDTVIVLAMLTVLIVFIMPTIPTAQILLLLKPVARLQTGMDLDVRFDGGCTGMNFSSDTVQHVHNCCHS